MTHIEFYNKEGKDIGFKMEGHAGYDTNGKDILCAALSATSQMTVMGVYDGIADKEDIDFTIDEPVALYGVKVTDHITESVAHILTTFRLYIMGLAMEYPKFISTKEVRL